MLTTCTCFSFVLSLLSATSNALTNPNCEVDLGLIPSSAAEPGTAECDADCSDCRFILGSGALFHDGAINCLSSVPCSVSVNATVHYSLIGAELRAQRASQLSVLTFGSGMYAWYDAVIHAPQNGGDFRFETSAPASVYLSKIYATTSGVVEIIFTSNGNTIGLCSMDVFASKAKSLSIELQSLTQYGYALDSRIECPTHSTAPHSCVWSSNATRFRVGGRIDLVAPRGTPHDVELICENADACSNVRVHCNKEEDFCEMQYSEDDYNWSCVGLCAIPPYYTTQETTESDDDNSHSGSGQKSGGTVIYIIVAVLCVVLLCAAIMALIWRRRKRKMEEKKAVNGDERDVSSLETSASVKDEHMAEKPLVGLNGETKSTEKKTLVPDCVIQEIDSSSE